MQRPFKPKIEQVRLLYRPHKDKERLVGKYDGVQSFLDGVLRIFGVKPERQIELERELEGKSDKDWLEEDWIAVGNDLRKVMGLKPYQKRDDSNS